QVSLWPQIGGEGEDDLEGRILPRLEYGGGKRRAHVSHALDVARGGGDSKDRDVWAGRTTPPPASSAAASAPPAPVPARRTIAPAVRCRPSGRPYRASPARSRCLRSADAARGGPPSASGSPRATSVLCAPGRADTSALPCARRAAARTR